MAQSGDTVPGAVIQTEGGGQSAGRRAAPNGGGLHPTPRRARRDVEAERNSAYPDTAYGLAAYTRRMQTAGVLGVLLGSWLLVAPWLLGYPALERVRWDDVAVGTCVIVVALVRVAIPLGLMVLTWTHFALGAWLVVAPWLLADPTHGSTTGALWNDILVGAALMALGGWTGMVSEQAPRPASPDRSRGRGAGAFWTGGAGHPPGP